MASSTIIKATRSISRASDCRDDTKMQMQAYANWEEYLTPAPISIAIMGELVFISSNVDFSINKNPPRDGFKFIRFPESFRACLMQVCNAGWHAFNEAHKNMDQIRLHTGNVPDYVTMSVKILLQDDDELIQTFLPYQLENINSIAEDCLNLATLAEAKFMAVINLIQELLEACTNSKQSYSEELEAVKLKIEEGKLREKTSREANERAQKAFKEMGDQINDAQKSFNESLDSMPTGWEMIGMDLVQGLSDTLNNTLSGMTSVITAPLTGAKSDGSGDQPTGIVAEGLSNVDGSRDDPFSSSNIFSQSSQLIKLSESFNHFIENNQIKWSEVYDQKSQSAKSDFLKGNFVRVKASINKEPECAPKMQALDICQKGINICNALAIYAPKGDCEDAKTKELVLDIQQLISSAQTFDSKAKASTNTPAFTVQPPHLSKSQSSSAGGKRAGQMATENARFKIEQTQAQLDKARAAYDKSLENMEKNQKELTDILVTMQNCVVKEIDFNTTIKMLVKGLDAMGQVKEQWEKMVRFFQMVSNIIKTCLTTSLTNFVKIAANASASNLKYTSSMFMKDMIYNQAFQASNIASLVNMISGTYTEVSAKYLMDRVGSLGRLMALDPSRPDFDAERRKLQNACEEAKDGISSLVKKNRSDFENKTQARLDQIKGALQAVMPPPSKEETQRIKEVVEDGFKEPAKHEMDQFS